jgi:uncharacterized zinc-type alcohol dehydrogenase-like protein
MIHVKAYAAPSATQPLAPFELDRRDVGPDDLLIDIAFCGVCHTDIHQARDEWGHGLFPMVPGHEIIGRVAQVGHRVKDFKPGDLAGVGCLVDSCRACPSCQEHLEQFCQKTPAFTYNGTEMDRSTPTYGGYSARIVWTGPSPCTSRPAWTRRARPPCCAPASPPTRPCATGAPAGTARWGWWAWAAWATWR